VRVQQVQDREHSGSAVGGDRIHHNESLEPLQVLPLLLDEFYLSNVASLRPFVNVLARVARRACSTRHKLFVWSARRSVRPEGKCLSRILEKRWVSSNILEEAVFFYHLVYLS
jgi:hypothetical protein